MTFPRTVVEFVSPPFVGPTVPHVIVNGQAITQQGLEIEWSVEPTLAEMLTVSGLSILHHLPESALHLFDGVTGEAHATGELSRISRSPVST